jgi:hypothetical protein
VPTTLNSATKYSNGFEYYSREYGVIIDELFSDTFLFFFRRSFIDMNKEETPSRKRKSRSDKKDDGLTRDQRYLKNRKAKIAAKATRKVIQSKKEEYENTTKKTLLAMVESFFNNTLKLDKKKIRYAKEE